MILVFGAAFEFSLILLMLNFTGVVPARQLIGWWRGVAALNDRRKGRGGGLYADLPDDEKSPLADDREPLAVGGSSEMPSPLETPQPVATRLPISSRYDDMT